MNKLWYALRYQELGYAVLPLHTVINGICSCEKGADCTSPGKHPRTMNGVKDASKDHEVIEKWFKDMPDSNIGIATGAISGFVAVDIDYKNNAEIGLSELESEYGKLPYSVEQLTGGGGRHLLFKHPGYIVENKVGIALGVDIRGDGGYIVAAPSTHISGNKYVWEASSRPGEMEMAALPEPWQHLLTEKHRNYSEQNGLPEIITEGVRNDTLFKCASYLHSKGLMPIEIKASIVAVNNNRCNPPLSDQELDKIVYSVQRYERGKLEIDEVKPEIKAESNLICMADIDIEEVKFLWKPYIPLGKIILIQGDPGDGKTTFALNIASIILKGGQFPENGGLISCSAGTVIYQTAEDGLADTIKPRLEKMGADCSKIFVIDESRQGLTLSDERIEKALQDIKPQLIIIDSLQAYLGTNTDMYRANEVRPILSKLGRIAEKHNCTVLLIMHLSKAAQSKSLYRGLGSIDFTAAARSVLLVGKNPNNPQERAIAQIKSSLAPVGKSIAFELDPVSGFVWKGESNLTDDDMLAPKSNSKDRKLDEAKELLEDLLWNSKEIPSNEIFNRAGELGISHRTIERAKNELKIRHKRIGYGSSGKIVWFNPSTTNEDSGLIHTLPNALVHTLAEYGETIENSGFTLTPPNPLVCASAEYVKEMR